MKRRRFAIVLGCAAAAAPLAAIAQPSATPVVGFLHSASRSSHEHNIAAFLDGLNRTGRVAGRNVAIEYRWADGHFDRLPALANELVRRGVSVLAAFAPPTVLAAKAATFTIPIVFTMGGDPVKLGVVASFNRPGGNITGVSMLTVTLVAKRLELIRMLVPNAASIAFIVNPSNPTAGLQLQDMRQGTKALGLRLETLDVSSEKDFETVSAAIGRIRPDALVVGADSFLISQRNRLVALAAQHAIPAVYETRESVAAGGLASYAPSLADSFRQAGVYVGRILNGEKPANLPILQPTKFELIINLSTAKSLGLNIPPAVLALADELID